MRIVVMALTMALLGGCATANETFGMGQLCGRHPYCGAATDIEIIKASTNDNDVFTRAGTVCRRRPSFQHRRRYADPALYDFSYEACRGVGVLPRRVESVGQQCGIFGDDHRLQISRGTHMIDGSAVLTVFLVYLAGVVIPGPNFVAVVHKAVAATRSEALALVAGIVLVNLFWSTCAIAGLGVVFAALPWAALVVKVLGAAYLMWFGFRLLINAGGMRRAR